MTTLHINLSSISVGSTDEYTSGAENSFFVRFKFSKDWDDLTKLVTFKAADAVVSQILDGDTIAIPHEVLIPKQDLWIGVLGTRNETIVLPTVWKKLRTVAFGVIEGAMPLPPTPSQYQQILNIAQSVRDDADAGRFDGEDGVSVVNVEIRNSHLFCILSNGTEIDAGEIFYPFPDGDTEEY